MDVIFRIMDLRCVSLWIMQGTTSPQHLDSLWTWKRLTVGFIQGTWKNVYTAVGFSSIHHTLDRPTILWYSYLYQHQWIHLSFDSTTKKVFVKEILCRRYCSIWLWDLWYSISSLICIFKVTPSLIHPPWCHLTQGVWRFWLMLMTVLCLSRTIRISRPSCLISTFTPRHPTPRLTFIKPTHYRYRVSDHTSLATTTIATRY